jgi:hypothetical protein
MSPISGVKVRIAEGARRCRQRAAAVLLAIMPLLPLLPLLVSAPARAGSDAATRPVLVELFTSQGCSSCPAADRVLGEIARRKDVVAISYAVDYWDYLGWHDTFGSRANSERQRAYAARLGGGMVYTPQLIIDGRAHLNGADRRGVEAAIAKRLQAKAAEPRVALSLSAAAGRLRITVGPAAANGSAEAPRKATLWLAEISGQQEVEVHAGENGGRSLAYHNISRDLMPIGEWSGQPIDVALPHDNLMRHGGDGCVAILQEEDGGPVLAAAILAPW